MVLSESSQNLEFFVDTYLPSVSWQRVQMLGCAFHKIDLLQAAQHLRLCAFVFGVVVAWWQLVGA